MRLKLLGKMLLYIMGPSVIGLILLASLAGYFATVGIEQSSDKQISELVRVQVDELNNLIGYIEDVANAMSTQKDMRNLAKLSNNNGLFKGDYFQEQVNAVLLQTTKNYRDVSSSFVVDKKGTIIAHTNPDRIDRNLADYQCVIDSISKKQVATEVRFSAQTNAFSCFVAAPIMDDDSAVGALILMLDLTSLAQHTVGKLKINETTNASVYGPDGIIIMNADIELLGKKASHISDIEYMFDQKYGTMEYQENGVAMLAYFGYVPRAKWLVDIAFEKRDFLSSAYTLIYQISGFAIIIALIASIIIFFVARSISKAMAGGALIASHVAAGNLTLTANQVNFLKDAQKRKDEVSELAVGMESMINNLAVMVKESENKSEEAAKAVLEAEKATQSAKEAAQEAASARRQGLLDAANQLEGIVNIITNASDRVASEINRSSQGASEQANRIAEAATAMEGMNTTVLEVARNSSASAELSDNTRIKATEGAEITNQCKDAITQVREDSMSLRTNMSSLAEHAQSINTVMGVISDIADQTNLLALNAAIEAARAGDAGRGFAVVADEVRKLAEKTIASTSDVANAIFAIQKSTESNVQQVDLAVNRIESATELAHKSGEALRGIRELADMSADGVRAIATASEEQSATADEIASSISIVNTIASDTNAAMVEANKAMADLAEQARRLAQLMENLKNS